MVFKLILGLIGIALILVPLFTEIAGEFSLYSIIAGAILIIIAFWLIVKKKRFNARTRMEMEGGARWRKRAGIDELEAGGVRPVPKGLRK